MSDVIRFEPDKHKYFLGKQQIPSVTQIISDLMCLDFRFIDPWYLEFGTAVHKAIELHIKDELDIKALDPLLRPYVAAFITSSQEIQFRIIESERIIFDPIIKIAGTMDILAVDLTEKLWVLDIKSGVPQPWHKLQTAGYAILEAGADANLTALPCRGCLYLRKNKTYKFIAHTDPRDFTNFKALATTFHARKLYG